METNDSDDGSLPGAGGGDIGRVLREEGIETDMAGGETRPTAYEETGGDGNLDDPYCVGV